jgi:hypothetical protein
MSYVLFTNCNEESLYGKAKKIYKVLRDRIDQIIFTFEYEVHINLTVTKHDNLFRFELNINMHSIPFSGEYRIVLFFNKLKELFSDCLKFKIEYEYGYQLVSVRPKSDSVIEVSLNVENKNFQDMRFHLVYEC